MHHERYSLHLHWSRGIQPSLLEVPEDKRVESILSLQLLECAHRVWYVTAMRVYTMLRSNTIHLKSIQTVQLVTNVAVFIINI